MIDDTQPEKWRLPIGYICPNCDTELFAPYRPFCGECGRKMPSELKMQSLGLISYPDDLNCIAMGADQINEFLQKFGTASIWLHHYTPSLRVTEIRFTSLTDFKEYSLVCTNTQFIHAPVGLKGWNGLLSIKETNEDEFEIYDKSVDMFVRVGNVGLYKSEVWFLRGGK